MIRYNTPQDDVVRIHYYSYSRKSEHGYVLGEGCQGVMKEQGAKHAHLCDCLRDCTRGTNNAAKFDIERPDTEKSF